MDDKQKVYIRVQKERIKDIDLIFEQLGYKDVDSCHIIEEYSRLYSYDPENIELIIYPHPNGEIVCTALTSFLGELVVDNYREIKLQKWKDGDILVDNDNPTKFIVKSNLWNGGWEDRFKAYLFVNPKHIQESPIPIFCDAEYHKADSEEVRLFHEILHKHGKDWDAKKKQLVEWKWKPKINDRYWTVCCSVYAEKALWENDVLDNERLAFDNCFKTKEEAEAMAEKVKKLLKGE